MLNRCAYGMVGRVLGGIISFGEIADVVGRALYGGGSLEAWVVDIVERDSNV